MRGIKKTIYLWFCCISFNTFFFFLTVNRESDNIISEIAGVFFLVSAALMRQMCESWPSVSKSQSVTDATP